MTAIKTEAAIIYLISFVFCHLPAIVRDAAWKHFPWLLHHLCPNNYKRVFEMNNWSESVKFSVLIWIWIKCQINKWPGSSSLNTNACFSRKRRVAPGRTHFLECVTPVIGRYKCLFASITLRFLAWFPPSAQFVTPFPVTAQLKLYRLAKFCFLMCTRSRNNICSKEAVLS